MTAETPGLSDTHCHLNLADFDRDRAQVIQRAAEAGVDRILVPGVDLASSRLAVSLAEKDERLFAAVGLHPHHAAACQAQSLGELRTLAASPRVVAIGEIGLDYYRNLAPGEAQRAAFRAQLELAAELGLPVIVHNRQAAEDVLADLLAWAARLGPDLSGRAGVLHAFAADQASASQVVEAGFYIGVAGPLTYRSGDERRRITAGLPLERLLVETDAPYLTPHPHRGQRNEPRMVRLVVEGLAALLARPFDAVAEATSDNAARLLGWKHGTDDSHVL